MAGDVDALVRTCAWISQVPGQQREPELHVLAIFDGYDGAEVEVVVRVGVPSVALNDACTSAPLPPAPPRRMTRPPSVQERASPSASGGLS